jgi:DNA-binding NtrC family response regulator
MSSNDTVALIATGAGLSAPTFKVRVVAGRDAGAEAASTDGRLTVGSGADCALVLHDRTVSTYHAELVATSVGLLLRDLGSTNGTLVGSIQVREALLREPAEIDVGRTRLALSFGAERAPVEAAEATSFGRMIGGSAPMRAVHAVLARAAPTAAPVLITGESGTGKELAARAVHDASPRAGGPFEVVDCGGLPPTLIESALFGHRRGAFTGATGDVTGAFERADGGTLFLDELGELPLELQPKLLRVLAEGEVRAVGSTTVRKVDVRVVAATNRDLRAEVNAGRFRADLFYRLAVIQVRMPPLSARLDDLPDICRELLRRIGRELKLSTPGEVDPETLARLRRHAWPGNVRELRNHLEQWVILQTAPSLEPAAPAAASLTEGLTTLPWRDAKAALIDRFERDYLREVLEATGGNVAEAARRAGVNRVTFFRTINRTGLRDDAT